jgi:general secretion pathway protein A
MREDRDEIGVYIEHRMRLAGSVGGVEWTPDAIDEVHRYSKGVPRLINLVCDRSLLACYIFRAKRIDQDVVRRSAQELSGEVIPTEPEPTKEASAAVT